MSNDEKHGAIVPARAEASLSTRGDEISPGAIAAAETARAMVVAAYGMAARNPRDYERSRLRILAACERPGFAERVEYSKPVGGGNVRGPSIRFAELALREFGNVRTDVTTIYEDDEIRRLQVTCTDLETNVAFGKQQTIRKTVERGNRKGRDVVGARINSKGKDVFIVKATEDELLTKEAAVVSKVLRNEGLRLIPADIVDEAIATAQATLSNRDLKDRSGTAKQVIMSFAQIGVTQTQLEGYLGNPVDDERTDFQELRAIYQAIKQGEAKWRDYSPRGDQDAIHVDQDAVNDMVREATKRGGGRQSTVTKPVETKVASVDAQEPAQAEQPQADASGSDKPPGAATEPKAASAEPSIDITTDDSDPECRNCGQPWSEHQEDDTCPGYAPGDSKFERSTVKKPQQGSLPIRGNHPAEREW